MGRKCRPLVVMFRSNVALAVNLGTSSPLGGHAHVCRLRTVYIVPEEFLSKIVKTEFESGQITAEMGKQKKKHNWKARQQVETTLDRREQDKVSDNTTISPYQPWRHENSSI